MDNLPTDGDCELTQLNSYPETKHKIATLKFLIMLGEALTIISAFQSGEIDLNTAKIDLDSVLLDLDSYLSS